MQDAGVFDDAAAVHGAAASDAGITEWQGVCNGRLVSLGWDWVRLHDGALVPYREVPPRTNLMLLDPWGYDSHGPTSDAWLWNLVATLDWQAEAARGAEASRRESLYVHTAGAGAPL